MRALAGIGDESTLGAATACCPEAAGAGAVTA
jgi:hypothetical protein